LWLFKLNPLAQSINDGRTVAILGVMPDIGHYAVMLVVGCRRVGGAVVVRAD
jgi:hypothetical protein